jgi:predicted 2-oxoglutarate/Fe(II)-dependent dioxygenase YbiX
MHVAESLFVGSVPAFLRAEDLAEIRAALAPVYAAAGVGALTEGRRGSSVHSIDGLSTAAAMQVYEPLGRDEQSGLPAAALTVLERAAGRALPTLRTMLPSARAASSFTFVSYGEGQFITPHIDLSDNDLEPDHPKVAGLSIALTDPAEYRGGEFFVETACDPQQWRPGSADRPATVRPECDASSAWYRAQVRSRWRVRPAAGDALLYGSQQTHGTEPVTYGRIDKIIGFLTA